MAPLENQIRLLEACLSCLNLTLGSTQQNGFVSSIQGLCYFHVECKHLLTLLHEVLLIMTTSQVQYWFPL